MAVLAVVEPQTSGFGGGTLITHLDGTSVRHFEGLAGTPGHTTDGLRTPTEQEQAELGVEEFESQVGLTVGIPGTVRVLEQAHRRGGRLPWRRLFDRAIELAERGFPMPPYLHGVLREVRAGGARAFYDPDSGLTAIEVDRDGLQGAADPRRDGAAVGD